MAEKEFAAGHFREAIERFFFFFLLEFLSLLISITFCFFQIRRKFGSRSAGQVRSFFSSFNMVFFLSLSPSPMISLSLLLFFVQLTPTPQRYKLLRELSGKKDQKGQTQAIFQLEDSGVIRTIEYFLDAIEFDPDNRLALCSFAELTAQCGLYETAEEYFLRALELDPQFCVFPPPFFFFC